MRRRYEVFVSSTFTDLRSERRRVVEALMDFGSIASGMELFPASATEPGPLIARCIDESDYYIVIIGGRYGSRHASGLSWTEWEYDYAVSSGKPVMAFLHADPDRLAADKRDVDAAARDKLQAFRTRIAASTTCRHWRTADDLAQHVGVSLTDTIGRHPAPGWIRADRRAGFGEAEPIHDVSGVWYGQVKQAHWSPSKGVLGHSVSVPVALQFSQGGGRILGASIVDDGQAAPLFEETLFGAYVSGEHFALAFSSATGARSRSFGTALFTVVDPGRLKMAGFANAESRTYADELVQMKAELTRAPRDAGFSLVDLRAWLQRDR